MLWVLFGKNRTKIICGIWDPFLVPCILYKISVLKNKRAVVIGLKTALLGFDISLSERGPLLRIKLYQLWVIVVFTYKINLRRFSTSFNFCGKERSFHFVNIPITVINPGASLKWVFVEKVFFWLNFACMAYARTWSVRICEKMDAWAGRV